MTTIAKVAVAGAVVLAALTVYHNTKAPAVAPPAQVVRPVAAPVPLPAPVAQPAPRPAPVAPVRKRVKPPVVAKHEQVKPPAPFRLPPPPPPPAPGWSERLLGHGVDRSAQRQR